MIRNPLAPNYHGFPTSLKRVTQVSKDHPLKLAITGKLGAGKSTVAQYLIANYDATQRAYANYLKLEVYDALANGLPNDLMKAHQSTFLKIADLVKLAEKPKLVIPSDAEKIAWVNARKMVMRPLLQQWGTEFRRELDRNYWIKQLIQDVQRLEQNECYCIVVDDIRFQNEAQALQEIGFTTVKVILGDVLQEERVTARDGSFDTSNLSHVSETELDTVKADFTLENMQHKQYLYEQIETVIATILNKG